MRKTAGYLAGAKRKDLSGTPGRNTTLVERLHIARNCPRQMLAQRTHQAFERPL